MARSAPLRPSNPARNVASGPQLPRNPQPPHGPQPRTTVWTQHRAPLITWGAFVAAHEAADEQLREYLHRGRKGSVCLTRDITTELDRDAALYLPANNARARMAYAQITARHLDEAIGDLPLNAPVFWVTFINRTYTVREDEAATFPVRRVQAWTQGHLRGWDYLGMVEAALFTNVDVVGAGYRRAVSWHTHMVVWGHPEEAIEGLCATLNARYRSLVPGVTVAHYRPLSYAEVSGRALYMNKGQISEYRVWPRRGEVVDDETGEITIVGTGRFSQGKRPLRSGDMARMCRVFAGRTLDRLAFAGGAGRQLLAAIRCEALAPYERQRRHEEAKRASQASLRHQMQRRAAMRNRRYPTGQSTAPK